MMNLLLACKHTFLDVKILWLSQFICWFPLNDSTCVKAVWHVNFWLSGVSLWLCYIFFPPNKGRWRECLWNLFWKHYFFYCLFSAMSCPLSKRLSLPAGYMFFMPKTHYIFSLFSLSAAPGGQFHLAGQPWSWWSYLPAYRGESDTKTHTLDVTLPAERERERVNKRVCFMFIQASSET